MEKEDFKKLKLKDKTNGRDRVQLFAWVIFFCIIGGALGYNLNPCFIEEKANPTLDFGSFNLRVTDSRDYEIMEYQECDEFDFMGRCELIIFGEKSAYIIMEMDFQEYFDFIVNAFEESGIDIDNVENATEEQKAILKEKMGLLQ